MDFLSGLFLLCSFLYIQYDKLSWYIINIHDSKIIVGVKWEVYNSDCD